MTENKYFSIQDEIKKLPEDPGVYIMRDKNETIIYVGKAKNLKNRVSQYFRKGHDEGIKKNQMVSNITRFEYIVTDTEMEALVLENNLIKEHRPKYNTLLRDDKTYPYIKVTIAEHFPRIILTRRVLKDGAKYYGPFTSAGSAKDTVELIQKICKLRVCSNKFPESQGKVKLCLNYHMKQCNGVCQGLISEEEYKAEVDRAIDFLGGNYKPIEKMLTEKMEEESRNLNFEKAAEYRDLIQSVKFCIQKQKITNCDENDRDIIALVYKEEDAIAQIFFVREGRMIGRDHFFISRRGNESRQELTLAFINQFYSGTPYIPQEIYVQDEIPEVELTRKWLSKKRGKSVQIIAPKRGQKEKLVSLAEKNALLIFEKNKELIKKEEGRTIGAVKEINKLLGVEYTKRMEAFDISNINGFASVGSMVVFENGKPLRSDYRKFRIKTVVGPDDYASMREVLTRRLKRGTEPNADTNDSFSKLPDIIMMDGGKGQVKVALDVIEKLGLNIHVCGMIKDEKHSTRGLWYNGEEVCIDKKSEGFKLITRIQDEAHRFAIDYHRSLRGKTQTRSFLDDIPLIGAKRRKALMKAFIGIEEIKGASIKELSEVPSMDIRAAEAVYKYLHK